MGVMKYYVHTTGCKANQWDTYVLSDGLKRAGMSKSSLKDADIVIVNACTLTDGAERDIRRFINRTRRENKAARIILAGCHGQVYPDRAFCADLVLGHEEKFRITEFLDKNGIFRSERDTFSLEQARVDGLPAGKTRFFLKIQDGCNNFCSYCIVPYARGNPRSRPAGRLWKPWGPEKKGVKEVVLTGIEISAYRDSVTGMDLRAFENVYLRRNPSRIQDKLR
jgi:threonylcarbamoyladenosine tRNA methylthiotransferase MtaB